MKYLYLGPCYKSVCIQMQENKTYFIQPCGKHNKFAIRCTELKKIPCNRGLIAIHTQLNNMHDQAAEATITMRGTQ